MTAFLGLLSLSSFAADQEDVTVSFDDVFVPDGFDSNDKAEVIITGEVPDTCHRYIRGVVTVVNNQITIEMMATKLSGSETNCISAVIPYMASISLGRLSEGDYTIVINAGAAEQRDAKISVRRPNTNSINNYTYANVMSVEELPGTNSILLKGVHPSSCMQLDRVEIITNEQNDTYSILPIIKAKMPICDQMMTPFSYVIAKPEAFHKKQLLHVRKIDGTAVNYLIENIASNS